MPTYNCNLTMLECSMPSVQEAESMRMEDSRCGATLPSGRTGGVCLGVCADATRHPSRWRGPLWVLSTCEGLRPLQFKG